MSEASPPPTAPPDSTAATTDPEQIQRLLEEVEQIVQVRPHDRLALGVLLGVYRSLGDQVRTTEYILRFAEAALQAQDTEAAQGLSEILRDHYSDNVVALEAAHQLEALLAESESFTPLSLSLLQANVADLSRELELAWLLHQHDVLGREAYAEVLHQLHRQALLTHERASSVLHVLARRDQALLEAALQEIIRQVRIPLIAFRQFEISRAATSLLDPDQCVAFRALPFDLMTDEDVMVATLNPCDQLAQSRLPRLLDRRCHFFLVRPDDFDEAMATVRKQGTGRTG